MCVNRHAEKIALCATALAVLLMFLVVCGEALGIRKANLSPGYETRLFDASKIHEVNIIMDKWEDFIATCENELYVACSVVIDGERLDNVGLRAKGNTSLANVRMTGSQRYSLKLEFDRYQTGKTYHGLDKLCLNNLIQDNTYMKDYLSFRLMGEFDAAAPLCSYALLRINGNPWGLFLAIEGIEESFLQRNYGNASGALYKPDTMGFGGGPGNGRNFRMENLGSDFMNNMGFPQPPGMGGNGFAPPDMGGNGFPPPPGMGGNGFAPPDMGGNGFPPPPDMGGNGFAPPDMGGNGFPPPPDMGGNGGPPDMGGGGPPGMGSKDVMLQYIDDDPDSYANIFGSAKTYVTPAAQTRLIRALRTLQESLEDGKGYLAYQAVYGEDVIRYFVVHNYVVNGDSYTGGMIHNYYLYEDAGKLRMLPWDYNFAFGGFQSRNASNAVNDPIDAPLSVSGDGSRPMADWLLKEPHINNYHRLFAEFLNTVDVQQIIEDAYQLIAPYAALDEFDPTRFCNREEFEAGVETLREFCKLRSESLSLQLAGEIPTTDSGQAADGVTLVDASNLDLFAMGAMGIPGGPGEGGGPPPWGN